MQLIIEVCRESDDKSIPLKITTPSTTYSGVDGWSDIEVDNQKFMIRDTDIQALAKFLNSNSNPV